MNRYYFPTIYFVIFLNFGLISPAFADNLLVISGQQDNYLLAEHFGILEDPTTQLDISDILTTKHNVRFKKNAAYNLSLKYSTSTYWLRIKIKNASHNDNNWLIQNNYANTHLMDVYSESNQFKPQHSGTLLPIALRETKQREIVFSVDLPHNKEQLVYIRLKTQGVISLNIHLISQQAFTENSAKKTLLLGIFYGILLIVTIYNLIFYISLKDISYLYLSLFMFFVSLSYSLYDGYLQLILSPKSLLATPYLIAMFTGTAALALILHRKTFLVLEKKHTGIRKTHDFLILAWILVITLAPFVNLVIIHNTTGILALLTVIYFVLTSLVGWRENKTAARFAVFGWCIFSLSLLIVTLIRLQIIPESFIVEHLLRASLLILVLLLSVALLAQINKLRVYKEKSHDILEYSELQRNLALEAAHLGIWRWQIASDLIYWSKRTCEIFGVQENEVPKSFEEYSQYIHPDDLTYLEKTVEHAIAGHQPYSLQHRIIRPDKTEVWVQCFGKIEFDEHDQFKGTIGTIQNITREKKLELEKQQTQKLYEDIFSSATEGFVIRSLDGKTIEANPAICSMYGYSKEEYLKLNLDQLIPAGSEENIKERIKTLENNQTYFKEMKRLHKNKSIFDVEIHATLINYRGKPHVFSIVHDITDRKQTENIIKRIAQGVSSATGEAFFQQLILQMAKLFSSEFAFISLIDKTEPKMLNTFVLCVGNKIADNISYAIKDTPCGEVLSNRISTYVKNVKKIFPRDKLLIDLNIESYIGTPLFDTQGKPIGIISIMDIKPMENVENIKEIIQIFAARTGAELERLRAQKDLKKHQAELENTVKDRTKELEAVNLELESFSYSVSHDLRSPLRAIDGFSKALMDDYEDKFDQEGLDLLTRVRKNTIRMGKLIDDLLNLSRLGRTKLNIEQVNLAEIAYEIISSLHENNPTREVKFTCFVTDTVTADKAQLQIVIDNLINNAWKYSSKIDNAKIEFGKTTKNNQSVFYIKDNGAGFDMAYYSKLFGAFQRLHGREFEGSGIGLATVQRIIRRHHGKIWAESELNRGATFYFNLGDPNQSKQTFLTTEI